MANFKAIRLLIWKNLVLRKRHWIVTGLEIFLPTIFAIGLAFLRTKIGNASSYPDYPDYDYPDDENTYFQETSENELIRSIRYSSYNENSDCAYGFIPGNEITNRTIEHLSSFLNNFFNDSFYQTCKWINFNSEEEFETIYAENILNQYDYERNQTLYIGAIVFSENSFNDLGNAFSQIISYKLRYGSDTYNTLELFPSFPQPGPDYSNIYRYSYGFSGLQIAIDKSIMKTLRNNNEDISIQINSRAFPYPPYPDFDFNQLYFLILPQFIIIGFIFVVPSIVRNMVSEKESGIKELLKMHGLPNWVQIFGWIINSLFFHLVIISINIALYFITFNSTTGAVLIHSQWTVWFFVLFLYSFAIISKCIFISSFFDKPALAVAVGLLVWIVSYYVPFAIFEQNYESMNLSEKLLLSLLPNMAIHYAIKIMSGYEGNSDGATWANMWEPLTSTDTLTVGLLCVMLVVSSILYLFLGVYFESVLPSKFGLRKPWYYPLMPSYWFSSKLTSKFSKNVGQDRASRGFEDDPIGLDVGIEIKNLKKVFSSKVAVDSINTKIYSGQVTSLLGQNGAGKTTTISILTGLFGPSSGDVIINGNSILTDMTKIRENIGLCPQHNMLFNRLTVREHLLFFGMLKGLTSNEAALEMKGLLSKLRLEEKKNVIAMALSGGQKRKLSLACAFIGKNQIAILDEPTSGLDPEARRIIWDYILEIRKTRTILLTTHFLEEADILSDRVIILANGKIQCSGSVLFLKKFFGTGYSLKISKERIFSNNSILSTVQNYIPEAIFANYLKSNDTELLISLPTESFAQFPEMFREIMAKKLEMGILSIGVSYTTLEDVFVKVSELENERGNGVKVSTNVQHDESFVKISGSALMLQQFKAIFLKKVMYSFRKWLMFICLSIIPVAVQIGTIILINVLLSGPKPQPSLKMSLSSYKSPISLFTSTNPDMSTAFQEITNPYQSKEIIGQNLTEALLQVGVDDLASYRSHHIVAAEITNSKFLAMFSSIPFHALPLSINMASNTILSGFFSSEIEEKHSLEISNHPLPNVYRDLIPEMNLVDDSEAIEYIYTILIPIGLLIFGSSFVIGAVEEKSTKSKHLQFMTGVNPAIYWIASFLWDFFVVLLVILLMIMFLPILEKNKMFTTYDAAGVLFLIFFVYGIGSIVFSYLLSLSGGSVSGRYVLSIIYNLLFGIVLSLISNVVQDTGDATGKVFRVIEFVALFLSPSCGLSRASRTFIKTAMYNSRCASISDRSMEIICSSSNSFMYNLEKLQTCCSNCQELVGNCFEKRNYLTWSMKKEQDSFYERDEWNWGILQDLLWSFIASIILFILIILVERGLLSKLIRRAIQVIPSRNMQNNDQDVLDETKRVEEIVKSKTTQNSALVINDLSKSYGEFSAVSRLNFAVHKGECFGLLGVNGAGKSTGFKMLTGDDCDPTFGNAYLNLFSLTGNTRPEFVKSIGYCPQFDALIGVLSGKEMLTLFARLRGIPSHKVDTEVNIWLENMGLVESCNVACKNYSGGMKRRLSAGLAMIGYPSVVILDEPTSGLDPIARRNFWAILSSSTVRKAGSSIILTSHSMEECEALCSRLCIMVNGEIQCLGSVQHLKEKFAQGFSITIRLIENSNQNQDNYNLVHQFMNNKFSPCEIKDQHLNQIQYQLFNESLSWELLFSNMELLKLEYSHFVQDYSIGQTNLEDIFLSFASKQFPERKTNITKCRKFLTCQF